MQDEVVVRHCSPTLAGIKTGSLFSHSFPNVEDMRADIRRLNRCLVKKGLRVIPLRFRNSNALIYVYRPQRLSCDLSCELAEEMLRECGYCCSSADRCILHLIRRLNNNEEFPHEIGLFLGYPPEDVHGFIRNKACGEKCRGYWKVYGDVDSAQRTFERYKKCTGVYCSQHTKGRSIEQLAVVG